MPAPFKVDWGLAQSLFQEGLPLTSVSKRTGIPYEGLAKRSKRYGWKQLVLPSDDPSDSKLIASPNAAKWQQRVMDAANGHLSRVLDMDPAAVPLRDLETLARILDITDKTGRRMLGLDVARSDQHMTIHLASEIAPVQDQTQEVIEVQCVPQQDSPSTDSAK